MKTLKTLPFLALTSLMSISPLFAQSTDLGTQFKSLETKIKDGLKDKKTSPTTLSLQIDSLATIQSKINAATVSKKSEKDAIDAEIKRLEKQISSDEALIPAAANFTFINQSLVSASQSSLDFKNGMEKAIAQINFNFKISFINSKGVLTLANYAENESGLDQEKLAVLRALAITWINSANASGEGAQFIALDQRTIKTVRVLKDDEKGESIGFIRLSDIEAIGLATNANTLLVNGSIKVEARRSGTIHNMSDISKKLAEISVTLNGTQVKNGTDKRTVAFTKSLQVTAAKSFSKPSAEAIDTLKATLVSKRAEFVKASETYMGLENANTSSLLRLNSLRKMVGALKQKAPTPTSIDPLDTLTVK